eukprot:7236718-Pyramimonas_sp.AAC.1
MHGFYILYNNSIRALPIWGGNFSVRTEHVAEHPVREVLHLSHPPRALLRVEVQQEPILQPRQRLLPPPQHPRQLPREQLRR